MHPEPPNAPEEALANFAATLNGLIDQHPLRQAGERGRPGAGASLAQAIDADPSLVRRWLRGKTLPTRSGLAKIAAALTLSHEEVQRLETAFVRARQGLLLTSDREDITAASSLATLAGPGQPQAYAIPVNSVAHDSDSRLPRPGAVIRGEEALAQAIIRLVACAYQREMAGIIYLTFSGAMALMDAAHRQARFQAVMREFLKRGGKLIHIIRLDESNITRTIGHIEMMLSYFGLDGEYEPYYLKNSSPLSVPYDLVVIPGIGSLICFATTQAEHLDAGIFLAESNQVDLLSQHVTQLTLRPIAEKFVRSFRLKNDGSYLFTEALAQLENAAGGRFAMKLDGLSALTRPESYYEPDSSFMNWHSQEERTRLTQAMYERWQAFNRYVSLYPYRDVCSQSSVVRYVKHGIFAHDDTDFTGGDRENRIANEPERQDHLKNVIRMLRDHENYELALVDEMEEKQLLHSAQWEAVGESGVALEVMTHDAEGSEMPVELHITEPSIVKAFQAYGRQIWKSISLANRDKQQVIAWLQDQLEILEKRTD